MDFVGNVDSVDSEMLKRLGRDTSPYLRGNWKWLGRDTSPYLRGNWKRLGRDTSPYLCGNWKRLGRDTSPYLCGNWKWLGRDTSPYLCGNCGGRVGRIGCGAVCCNRMSQWCDLVSRLRCGINGGSDSYGCFGAVVNEKKLNLRFVVGASCFGMFSALNFEMGWVPVAA